MRTLRFVLLLPLVLVAACGCPVDPATGEPCDDGTPQTGPYKIVYKSVCPVDAGTAKLQRNSGPDCLVAEPQKTDGGRAL